jgi:hypothetical protein
MLPISGRAFLGSVVLVVVLGGSAAQSAPLDAGTGLVKQEERHLRRAHAIVAEYLAATNPLRRRRSEAKDWTPEIKDWAIKDGKAQAADFVSSRDHHSYFTHSDGVGACVLERVGKDSRCYFIDESGQFQVNDAKERAHINRARALAASYIESPEGRKGAVTDAAVRKWLVASKKGTAKDLQSTRDHKSYIIIRAGRLGPVVVEAQGDGWRHMSSIEGTGTASAEKIKRLLQSKPAGQESCAAKSGQ